MKLIDTEYNVHSAPLLIGNQYYAVHLWLSEDLGPTDGDPDSDPDLYQITLRKIIPTAGGHRVGNAAVFTRGPREDEAVSVGLTRGHVSRQGGVEGSLTLFKQKLDEFVTERDGQPISGVDQLIASMDNEELKEALRFVKGFGDE